MLEAELIVDLERLEMVAPEWDALAVANGLPQMAPAWVLAWWRHIAPPDARARVVAVRDGDRLVGLAPFYVGGSGGRLDYRLPGIEIAARLAPLAAAGREWDVAGAIGRTLAAADPRPDALLLEGTPLAGHWPAALRERWPGGLRPKPVRQNLDRSPFVSLREESFDAWLAGRSSNFRSQMKRMRRRFAEAGGVSRLATQETLAADAAAFSRLHALRWRDRGHSNLVDLGERFSAMLVDVGEQLIDADRLNLRMLEIDGEPVCAQAFLGAGGETLFVNGGWDERFARLKPSLLCLLDAVEDAFARGDRRLDLGVGEQSYKLRFADGDAPLAWLVLMLPGRRLPLTAARTAPAAMGAGLRATAARNLSPERLERLRRLRSRALS